MTLSQLLTEIYGITHRPDKITETTAAVKNAVLKLHGRGFFPKDIQETGISFAAAANQQSLAYKGIFSTWRAVSYIQPLDGTTFLPSGLPLDEANPQFILDDYNVYKENIYYVAGQVLQIRTKSAFQYFQIGAYCFPDVTVSDFSTWLTDEHPYAVVYDAAATVFRGIGYMDEFKANLALAQDLALQIDIDSVGATGY